MSDALEVCCVESSYEECVKGLYDLKIQFSVLCQSGSYEEMLLEIGPVDEKEVYGCAEYDRRVYVWGEHWSVLCSSADFVVSLSAVTGKRVFNITFDEDSLATHLALADNGRIIRLYARSGLDELPVFEKGDPLPGEPSSGQPVIVEDYMRLLKGLGFDPEAAQHSNEFKILEVHPSFERRISNLDGEIEELHRIV